MITKTLDSTATQPATVNDGAVRRLIDLDPEFPQPAGHRTDPVTFLDAELADAAERCAAFGASRSHEQHRKLVDGQRHERGIHIDTAQPR